MNKKIHIIIITILALITTSCGGGGRSVPATTPPSGGGGGNNPNPNPNPNLPTISSVSTSCEYYGYSTLIDGTCSQGSGVSKATLASNQYQSVWQNQSAYMQVAEANALLSQVLNKTNLYGQGTNIAIVGSGVNNVVSSDTDGKEINIAATTKDFGYALSGTTAGSIFHEITKAYGPNGASTYNKTGNWYQGLKSISYSGATTNNTPCNSDNATAISCADKIYALKSATQSSAYSFDDRDHLTLGNGDVAEGTMLASVLTKDGTTDTVGIARNATVVGVKTMFKYQKTSSYEDLANKVNNYSYNSTFLLQDNTMQLALAAVRYAKANSDVILFNNHSRQSNAHNHSYFYTQSGSTSVVKGKVRTFADIISPTTNKDFGFIKNELNDTGKIYVTPTSNVDIANLIKTATPSEGRSYASLIAVADVNVSGMTYNSTADSYGINGIATITLTSSGSESKGEDCTGFANNKCLIAPGNIHGLSSTGSYTVIGTNEYAGSAYVTGAIATIRAAYTPAELSNTAIISKIMSTATSPTKIAGCSSNTVDTGRVSVNCGAGMVNLYEALKPVTAAGASIASGTSITSGGYSLDNTSLAIASSFGDGLIANGANIFSQASFFDDYGFRYNAGLLSKVTTTPSKHYSLDILLANNGEEISTERISLGRKLQFNIAKRDIDEDLLRTRRKKYNFTDTSLEDSENDISLSNLSFNSDLAGGLELQMNIKSFNSESLTAVTNSDVTSNKNSYLSLVGEEISNVTIGKSFNKVRTNFSILSGHNKKVSWNNNSKMFLAGLGYNSKHNNIMLNYGRINESETLLNSRSSGALSFQDNVMTDYYGLSFNHKLSDKVTLFGNYNYGITDVNSNDQGVLRNFDNITSSEFKVGALTKSNRSELGLSYSQPMRVKSGTVDVNVPVSKDISGTIYRTSEKISLVPTGKEEIFEAFFNKQLANDKKLKLNVIHRKEPNHVEKANSENIFLLQFSKKF